MPDPTPEHLILLRGILDTGNRQAQAILDITEALRAGFVAQARTMTEHEASAARRHEEVRPVLESYHREISARESAIAERRAEAEADRDQAVATWWRIARIAGYVLLPIALGLASRYLPSPTLDAAPTAMEATP